MHKLSISTLAPLTFALALVACGESSADDSTTSIGVTGASTTGASDETASDGGATGDSSSGASTSEDDGGFLTMDSTVESMCDPFAQDCGEGQKCVPYVPEGGGAWEAVVEGRWTTEWNRESERSRGRDEAEADQEANKEARE